MRYQSVGGIVPLILTLVRKTIIAILALIERSSEDRLRHLLLPFIDVV